ncbi:hypothetical protein [[Clostridium] colinum]|uniref:hypothetical protein n=1 Tax=[Clostridium] colinum TaxID=36835 RepID=UPI002023D513|nr:hypothetical protein [[Clostridium] colinum]
MEKLKYMVNKIGKNMIKSSKDIIKNTKLSMQLSSQEEKLKNIYIDIGKKVYEIYSYGGNIGEFFDEKYKQILDIEKQILETKQKIEENKNISKASDTYIKDIPSKLSSVEECRICRACGQKNDINNKFCLNCGRAL